MKRSSVPTSLQYDPCRRLLVAVVLQAVRDAHFPEQRTPQTDRVKAREFLADDRASWGYGRYVIDEEAYCQDRAPRVAGEADVDLAITPSLKKDDRSGLATDTQR